MDSRGEWTVEVKMGLEGGDEVRASVPQGKSRGRHEAVCVSTEKAVENIEQVIGPKLIGMDSSKQNEIDNFLVELDGTESKANLGANAILGVSLACARAGAKAQGLFLWQYLALLARKEKSGGGPRLFINMVNGGLHAGNNLDFQEYLVVPRVETVKESIETGVKVYQRLKEILREKFGPEAENVGDEGGFAPNFENNEQPLAFLNDAVNSLGLSREVDFGLDAAASQVSLSNQELFEFYEKIYQQEGVKFLEDVFAEDDFDNFALLAIKLGPEAVVIGDDLVTTNIARMKTAYENKSINAVIIKPNQIGTLTETLEAAAKAGKYGWKVIVSHRSGETNDSFAADLAFGIQAYGIKAGGLARGERVAKYNRLLEIEEERR